MNNKLKAFIFTVFFSLFGFIMVYINFDLVILPRILFYIVLLVNSYFSIDFFSKITPERIDQKIIDLLLVISYLFLILNLGNEVWYLLSAIMLFIVATLKYVFLLGVVDLKVLKKKMIIDIFGIILGVFVLVGYLIGFGIVVMWIWALIFLVANIYLLFIRPMYKFDK